MRFAVAAVFIAFGFCSAALAGLAGTLDPTFGVGGRVVGRQLFFEHIVQAPDGDIIAVGKERGSNNGVLARYQSDGSLDPSFGSGGLIIDSTVLTTAHAFSELAIQPDGKFLDVMRDRVTFDDEVRRHLPSGALDPTFDGDGILPVPNASRLALQADGSILVASLVPLPPNNTNWDVRLSRYDSTGAPDLSFGSGGSVVTHVGTRPGVSAIVLQPDGGILVTGSIGGPVTGGYVLRYLAGGSLDPSFGNAGIVSEASFFSIGDGLALQADGKILTSAIQVARRDASGVLDPTFGVGGIGSTLVRPVAVQADGRIVGTATVNGVRGVRRLMPDGSVDMDFGDAGNSDTSADLNGVRALLRQADGRLVAALDTEYYFPLERYLGGTCGDSVVEGGEECDDGNATPGDGCEPGCCLADADGDGRCNAHDPCTNPAPTSASVTFSGGGTLHHRFKLKGTVDLPSPALDPLANGVRIVIRESGQYLYDFTFPGGAPTSPPGYGWTASGSPARTWKFNGDVTGPSGAVPYFAEAKSIKISRTNNTPNRVKFALKAMFIRSTEPVSSVTATLVVDSPTAATGECGEVTLPCLATGSSVRCRN